MPRTSPETDLVLRARGGLWGRVVIRRFFFFFFWEVSGVLLYCNFVVVLFVSFKKDMVGEEFGVHSLLTLWFVHIGFKGFFFCLGIPNGLLRKGNPKRCIFCPCADQSVPDAATQRIPSLGSDELLVGSPSK